jgi:hypothetical protein
MQKDLGVQPQQWFSLEGFAIQIWRRLVNIRPVFYNPL